MKAAVLKQINAPLSIEEVGLTPLQVGQVLVKVLVSGLCGAQLHEIRGHKGNAKFLPHLMGHEGCGIVEKVGPGVSTVKAGEKVVMHWRVGTGIESTFPSYFLDNKIISSGKVTTLSEYSIVSENRLTAVPADTPNYLCALLGCGLTTALGIINNEVDLKFGESIMIIGCGGVGLNLIQGASLASAYPIIGVDVVESKREKVMSLKANCFINTKVEDLESVLSKNLTNGKADVIVDTTGMPKVIAKMMHYLSDSGRFILVGQPRPGEELIIPNGNNWFGGNGKILKASQGGKTNPANDIPRYIRLHKSGILDIDKIVSHKFALEEINAAFDLLRTGNAGRIMIDINGSNG
jgi:S-(hydroxymethyl)glutathione dehydrogenase/alcohol dehydrogenase